MENYDGLKLRPLFYSEISSSFMVYEIFSNYKKIAKDFLKNIFGLVVDDELTIVREKTYPKKGSIDIFLSFKSNGKKTIVLIEVKVHDYLSVSANQIKIYYEAALEELGTNDVYFVYLTQFSRNNIPSESKVTFPNSIKEFEDSLKVIPKGKMKHINWEEFHRFINPYKNILPKEYSHLLELQKAWIIAKSKEDTELNTIDVGERELSSYFSDIDVDVVKEIPFGNIYIKDKKEILSVDLEQCNLEQLNKIISIIKTFANSVKINRRAKQTTKEETLTGVKEFLLSLVENSESWLLLSFYSSLFDYVGRTDYLKIHGTGSKGFSIKVNVKNKGVISLCTIWISKKIDFSIKR